MNFTFINRNYRPPVQSKNIIPPKTTILIPLNSPLPKNVLLPVPKPTVKIDPPEKKAMTWGEPTWFFFHTLAEKMKPEKFPKIKRDLVNITKMICNNLPCPICSEHATAFMNRVNFNNINSREDLKLLFFRFHNEVNARKGYTIFTEDELHEKYPSAITNNIFNNFVQVFERKSTSMRLMADSLHRNRIMEVIKKWLFDNRSCFMD
jgi:hypothetical protein